MFLDLLLCILIVAVGGAVWGLVFKITGQGPVFNMVIGALSGVGTFLLVVLCIALLLLAS